MIKNIGGKLQGLGKFILWAGIVTSAIAFAGLQIYIADLNELYWIFEEEISQATTISIAVLIAGPIVSMAIGFFYNGLGTLINNTMPKPSPADPMPTPVLKTDDDII